jgi:hypothetical protein
MTWLLAIRWPWWLAWLGWLLDTSMGPPGPRGHFSPSLTVAFHGSNALMSLAFLAVPLIVMRGYRHRREGISTGVLVAANVLAASMAASRFARVLEMYGPPYRLTTILDCVAAITSAYCVLKLYPVLSTILKLPSRHELHDKNDLLNAEIMKRTLREHELAEINRVLEAKIEAAQARIGRMEHDRVSSEWWAGQRAALLEIQGQFRELADVGGAAS